MMNIEHISVFNVLILFSLLFFGFTFLSRRGQSLYLRRIPGIQVIEEAVGRATEMGRPVLYVPGIDDIDEIQTLASLGVLPHVARIVAEYDSTLIVPVRKPIVMSICEEIIKGSFSAAGRPDSYKPHNIRYLSSEQFAYTAGVGGIMLREKPAANIYLGMFYSESLILAETGFINGAIQVAGTASIHQLPFFIAACDYTLIGEELFAASAYLSKDPKILAGVKASDYFKIIVIAALLIGVFLSSMNSPLLAVIQHWF